MAGCVFNERKGVESTGDLEIDENGVNVDGAIGLGRNERTTHSVGTFQLPCVRAGESETQGAI